MHLKSIEMAGFKSFANRTAIDLKEGFTAVVGPNGCGKSNIVDALRWCLGEMSPKSLRSKQMLDVIFAGSSSKTAQNLAEVTLTFDNAHRLLPTDFTEVQVTRRIFRSGESEYFLNKTQCRLKDIRDLFLDTGIGEGYSILAQGEVDFVIQAKPEERRELFEEAAGISKYKARREETLRKLEKVEIDLNRLNDVISLLKEQMDSLEAAAKKAQNYQKIKEELKNLEIADSLFQNSLLEEELKSYGKKLKEFQDEIQKGSTQLDIQEVALTQNRIEKDTLDAELYKINSSLLELEKEIDHKDQTVATAKEREQEFKETTLRLSQQIERTQKELEQSENRFQTLNKDLQDMEERAHQLKGNFEEKNGAWVSVQKERKNIELEKSKVSSQLFQCAQDLKEIQNEKNRYSSLSLHKELEIAASKKEFEKYRVEESKLKEEKTTLEGRLNHLESSLTQIQEVVLSFQTNLNVASRRESELTQHITQIKEKLIQSQTKLQVLQENFQVNPYRKGTSAILKQGFPGLKGVVGLLFKYPENIAPLVEAVLGNKINYLVFETVETAERALHWLRENKIGRATCFILDKIPLVHLPQTTDGNRVIQLIQSSPDLDKLKNVLFGSMILSGSMVYDASTIDGGIETFNHTSPDQTQRNSSYVQQLFLQEQLKGEIDRCQKELALLEQEHGAIQNELQTINSSRRDNGTLLEKQQLEIGHLQELLARKIEEIDLDVREIALLEEKLNGDLKEKESSDSLSLELEEKIKTHSELECGLQTDRNKIDDLIQEKLSLERTLELNAKESEVRLESFEETYQKNVASLNEWKKHQEEYLRQIESAKNERERCDHRILECQTLQKTETASLGELETKKIEISKQSESIISKKSEFVEKEIKLQEEVQKLRETLNSTSGIMHEIELELRTSENRKKNILEKLQESYSLSIEEAIAQFQAEEIQAEEILKLKKRIESMSSAVNLEAPEQYKSLQERYQFLETQVADLSKAKEDLQNAIRQINGTTREQFRQTFAKVRENFRTIYGQLFEGGVADLVFTDEENILDTGIEIVAQPPGKKLQNIVLLSGGEKTLTAISLLFAFFMVRPSPICLLDEVDAPLDPANVTRYLKLLKVFSAKTQFLAVTHNPKTMENADILYGVTMEESGVSKILSARLKKDASNQDKVNIELVSN